MKTVFVSGANGKIGQCLVRRLSKQGYQVIALCRRKNADFKGIRNINLVVGDVTDLRSLQGMGKADYLIHLAAGQRPKTFEGSDVYKTNIGGTENLLSWAVRSGVRKVVYVSTIMVFEDSGDKCRSENWPKRKESDIVYVDSKIKALRVIEKFKKKIKIATVYPTIVIDRGRIGQGGVTGQWWQDMIWRILGGGVPGGVMSLLGPGERIMNFIWMDDLVDKLIFIMEEKDGDEYILGGENVEAKNYLRKIGEITGRKGLGLRTKVTFWLRYLIRGKWDNMNFKSKRI